MLRREVSALSNACVQESTAFDAHFRDGASQQGLEQDNALLSQLVAEYGLFSALASGLARSFDETFAMPLARESVVQEVDACRLHCLWLLASQRRFSAPVVQRWTDRHLASFSFAKRDDGTALMRIDLTVLGGSTGGFGADRIAGSLARSIVSPQVIEADYARRGDPHHSAAAQCSRVGQCDLGEQRASSALFSCGPRRGTCHQYAQAGRGDLPHVLALAGNCRARRCLRFVICAKARDIHLGRAGSAAHGHCDERDMRLCIRRRSRSWDGLFQRLYRRHEGSRVGELCAIVIALAAKLNLPVCVCTLY